MLRYKTELDLV